MQAKRHSYHTPMHHAISLAKKAQWATYPNPCVGAVLVHNGAIVAEGWHQGKGTDHAEVMCLNAAQAKKIPLANTTLVVTLEPCNHSGSTPPCVEAILKAGIKHVVIGTLDPNPEAGGGAKVLQSHGVLVEVGCAEEACKDLIADFAIWQLTPYPYVTLKLASTLDGRIATRTGHSKWISSQRTRDMVQGMRRRVQAILVGGNTFYQDNPQLTCRIPNLPNDFRQPLAVIATSRLPDAKGPYYLLQKRPNSTIFWTTVAAAASPKAEALRKLGAHVLGLPSRAATSSREHGTRAELQLDEGIRQLRSDFGCHYVLCEGGGRLGLSLLAGKLAQELHLHLAPKILGDNEATPLFDGNTPNFMDDALQLRVTDTQLCHPDVIITLRPQNLNNTTPPQQGS